MIKTELLKYIYILKYNEGQECKMGHVKGKRLMRGGR
jgi:hypothetical protein